MELLLPSLGIFVWTLLAIVCLILPVFTIYKLAKNNQLQNEKIIIWLLVILFFPFLGALAYFIFANNNSLA